MSQEPAAPHITPTQRTLLGLMEQVNGTLDGLVLPMRIIKIGLVCDGRLFEIIIRWEDGHRSYLFVATLCGSAQSIVNAVLSVHLVMRVPSIAEEMRDDEDVQEADEAGDLYKLQQHVCAPGYTGDAAPPLSPEDEHRQTVTLPTRRLN